MTPFKNALQRKTKDSFNPCKRKAYKEKKIYYVRDQRTYFLFFD